MASLIEIKEAVDGLGAAFTQFKDVNDKRLKALEAGAPGLLDRVEELEARASSPGRTGTGGRDTPEQREHKERFLSWLRRPQDHAAKSHLAEAEIELSRVRGAVTEGAPASGGYAVPMEISRDIESRVKLLNPFRSLVAVRQAGSSDFHDLVSMGLDESGWVGEGDTRNETDTPGLRDRKPTFGTIYAYPKASEESLQDIFFNVQNWLVENAADSFAAQEAIAIVSGNGSKKPTGFLDGTPVTTVDDASPLRDEDALQYFAVTNGSPVTLGADDLIALATSGLKEKYLLGPGVGFVMHRMALAMTRALKSPAGHYVYQEPLAAGTPGTLLGYPVWTSDAMNAPGASGYPIAFGNWARAYVLVDLGGMRITVDDNITSPGQVKFYIRRRVGGIVRNNDALKLLKF